MTTKEELLGKLMKLQPTSVEDSLEAGKTIIVLTTRRRLTSARKRVEDDIVAGASKMTLKDPVCDPIYV